MCESTAFLKKDGKEELLMNEVALVSFDGNKIILRGLLGDYQEVAGRVELFDLMAHKIVILPE